MDKRKNFQILQNVEKWGWNFEKFVSKGYGVNLWR